MMLRLTICCAGLVLLLGACDGSEDGGSTDPSAAATACAGDHVAPNGVGKPCERTGDCGGDRELFCPAIHDPGGLRFCTVRCDYGAEQDPCAAGSTCVYVGGGGRCVPDGCGDLVEKPLPESTDSAAGRVNQEGVGQPCDTYMDCSGTTALLCEKDSRQGGWDFCTADCAFGYSAYVDTARQCGSGAECAYIGNGRGRCVPAGDAERLGEDPPAELDVDMSCDTRAVNEGGVGKPCETHADCAGNNEAPACPYAIFEDDRMARWCSHLCEYDDHDSCGPGAFCWWRATVEDRGGMVGSCTPCLCLVGGGVQACE